VNVTLPIAESPLTPLPAERLYGPTDMAALNFATTAELQPLDGLLGQERASEAIRFGTQIDRSGFNLFVIGPHGTHMQDTVKAVLAAESAARPSPSDWVYVHNFKDADRPVALALPAGQAVVFHDAMHKLIDDLKSALPAVFQSEDYQTRRGALDDAFQKKQADAFSQLHDRASEKNIAILRTPLGFGLAPTKGGKVVPPDEFAQWPEKKRNEVRAIIEALEKELEHIVHQIPQWEKERRDEMRRLNRETAGYAVNQSIEDTKIAFRALPKVADHIEAVRLDLIENVALFMLKDGEESSDPEPALPADPFDRYEVNVFVAHDDAKAGAPVIEELHPTLPNLIGRIEYMPVHGALVTNFRLIKPGAIHRVNGGFLLLDARSVLMEPFAWTALKRTLRRGEITIEDVARFLGYASTASLEPDPIPLKLKVVIFGDRMLYYLLAELDPDIAEHFKVLADFENDFPRTAEHETMLAQTVAMLVKRDGLMPLDRDAVALVLEQAARAADHARKLSLVVEPARDLLIEADFFAREARRSVTGRADVQAAIDARIRRAARIRDRAQDSILEQVALISTDGRHVGQVNGLSVVGLGGFSFGRPSRITCQVRPGAGKLIDIEREVALGGPLHSKGVLILSGFLAGRYALDTPMSLFASLVFEQSYGGVEGDSASSAELYALMSALADVPLRQDLAVTGSVNQHGVIQAIGGVNEKIEGFFDICTKRGLSGTQGVLIPEANVQHLMLRKDVIEACAAGRFAVYAVRTIDEGIALLAGLPAGARGDTGRFADGSVNARVEERLRAFADVRRSFAGGAGTNGSRT